MLGPFSIDAIFPAFPAMQLSFGAPAAAMQQAISFYLAGFAGMSLLLGPLSDAYGRRRVILATLTVFWLATIGAALASSLTLLLAWRLLQGCSAGAGMIVGRAIIRDCFAGADAQRLMSQVNLIFGAAPAAAPIVGGLIVAAAGWRAIFWAVAGFTALLLAACVVWLPESLPPAQRAGLAPRRLASIYRRITVDRGFMLLAAAAACNFAALFVYIAAAPVFVLRLLQLSVRGFGWLFVPVIAGLMFGSLLASRLAGRCGEATIMRLGYRFIAAGWALDLLISALQPQPRLPWAVLPLTVAGVGISLAFPTLTLLMLDRFPANRGAAASLQAAISLAACSLVSGLLAPMVAGHASALALAAAALALLGYGCWLAARRLLPSAPSAVPMARAPA
ncbi:MAG: Bcr/CflA family efflux MFS transporter [Gammaproteobacteria bacterium]|nr:Bcr/CflA family efflux MFS transporter [Gammaproteobacteria bacterium]